MNEHIYKSAIDKIEFSDNLNIKTLSFLDSHKSRKKHIQRSKSKKFYIGLTALIAVFILTINIYNNSIDPLSDIDSDVGFDVSSSYPAYSLEDLVIFSHIIAIGEVKSISEPIEIRPVGGGDTDLFTDYTLGLEEVFKDSSVNSSNASKSVPLRIRTGKPGVAVSDGFDYNFKIGDRYLFFLSYPTSGGGYTVNDDHITLVGHTQGLLEITEQNEYYSQDYGRINNNELLSIINDPDIQKSAEQFDPLDGLKENLRSGFISQEEYDKAIEDLGQYAEIVND